MDAGDPGGIPADRAFRDGGLERLQQLLGYQFRDPALLNLALTHSSVAYEEQTEQELREDNEQLEFLGDAVLGLVVTEHLYRMYPEFSEGAWTRLRSQFVSRPHLASVALSIGLGDFLRLGKGEEKSGGRKKPAILANAVESVIAAVYLDGGMESAVRLIRTWLLDETMEAVVEAARAGEVGDFKSMLQEYSQAHGLGQPRYQLTSETGPDHRKSFAVEVKFLDLSANETTLASATGTRKKHAEQEAARLALQQLRSLHMAERSSLAEGLNEEKEVREKTVAGKRK
ncbi:MAG: ribonuclease III [Acidobacteriaceae bacterium]|jgi:ribonuclease III